MAETIDPAELFCPLALRDADRGRFHREAGELSGETNRGTEPWFISRWRLAGH